LKKRSVAMKVKVRYGDDIRRLNFTPEEFHFSQLRQSLSLLFEFNGLSLDDFVLKYVDDEDDYITISSEVELQEAVRVSAKEDLLRLVLFRDSSSPYLASSPSTRTLSSKPALQSNDSSDPSSTSVTSTSASVPEDAKNEEEEEDSRNLGGWDAQRVSEALRSAKAEIRKMKMQRSSSSPTAQELQNYKKSKKQLKNVIQKLTLRVVELHQKHQEKLRMEEIMKMEQEEREKEKQRMEKEKEQQRIEKENVDKYKMAEKRIEKERIEKERLEQEKLAEKERIEKERAEKEMIEKEKARLERERMEREACQKLEEKRIREQNEQLERTRLTEMEEQEWKRRMEESQKVEQQVLQQQKKMEEELARKRQENNNGHVYLEPQRQLEDMGFRNKAVNIRLLTKHKGDLLETVRELLEDM